MNISLNDLANYVCNDATIQNGFLTYNRPVPYLSAQAQPTDDRREQLLLLV